MDRKARADFRAEQKALGRSPEQIDRMLAAADAPAKGKGASTGTAGGRQGLGRDLPLSATELTLAMTEKLSPALKATIVQYDKWATSLQKVSAQNALQMEGWTKMAINLQRSHVDMGLTMEETFKNIGHVWKNYSGIVTFGGERQIEGVVKQIAVFEKLGVEVYDTTDMMNLFAGSLGLNRVQVSATAGILNRFAVETKQGFGKVWGDFNKNISSFMTIIDNKQMIGQTLAMAAAARRMGVSVSGMMGSLQQFETLEGAQQAAGKINAVMGSLGGSFDAVKAAGMDFTQRQQYIAKTIQSVYGRIEASGPRAGRAYIGALSKAFGMDARTIKAMAMGGGAALPAEKLARTGALKVMSTAETQRRAAEAATWGEREAAMKDMREALIYKGLIPLAAKLKKASGDFDKKLADGATVFVAKLSTELLKFMDKHLADAKRDRAYTAVEKSLTEMTTAAGKLSTKARQLGGKP